MGPEVFFKKMYLKKYLKKTSLSIFFTLVLIGGFSLFLHPDNSLVQLQILSFLSVTYLIWAVIHHYLDKSLTLEIVVEYFLIASLVVVVLSSILL